MAVDRELGNREVHSPECLEALRAGSRRLDGELEAQAVPALEAHLNACTTCREELRDIELAVDGLRTSPLARAGGAELPLSPDLRSKILSRIDQAAPSVTFAPVRALLLRAAAGLLIAVSAGLVVFMVEGAPQSIASETLHLPADQVAELLGCFEEPGDARAVLVATEVRRTQLMDQLRTCEARVHSTLAAGADAVATSASASGPPEDTGPVDRPVDPAEQLSATQRAVDLLQVIGLSLETDRVPENPGIWPLTDGQWQNLWDALCCWVESERSARELPLDTCDRLRELPLRTDLPEAAARLDALLVH